MIPNEQLRKLVDDALTNMARLSRKDKDYEAERKYATTVLDRYPTSDQAKTALLQVADSYKRQESWTKARTVYLDYTKKYPGDEDAPWAWTRPPPSPARRETARSRSRSGCSRSSG
jgi:outer membrane protein assembly factor BamD (BamD/ComL family)